MSTATPPRSQYSQEDVESGKLWAVLGYLFGITALVPLIQKDNDFALYHARQTLVLMIFAIPTCGGCVVGGLIFAVIGILNAVGGKYEPLPVIGRFGEEWFGGFQKEKKG